MIKTDKVLDAKGLACPMPIVKTKQAMNELAPGQVLEIAATDKGSTADLKAWAKSIGHQYLGTIEADGVLKHYLRKANSEEEVKETKHPDVMSNDVLDEKLRAGESVVLIDVREEAEYAFNHIPGAVSIPLGDIEAKVDEINKDSEIAIICRSGNRSDLAAQILTKHGFTKVYNVMPGMCSWSGETKGINA